MSLFRRKSRRYYVQYVDEVLYLDVTVAETKNGVEPSFDDIFRHDSLGYILKTLTRDIRVNLKRN